MHLFPHGTLEKRNVENFAILVKLLWLISHPNYSFVLIMSDWEFGMAKGSDMVSQERNGHLIHLGHLLNIIIITETLWTYGMPFNHSYEACFCYSVAVSSYLKLCIENEGNLMMFNEHSWAQSVEAACSFFSSAISPLWPAFNITGRCKAGLVIEHSSQLRRLPPLDTNTSSRKQPLIRSKTAGGLIFTVALTRFRNI